jgi:Predicted transcription factor, homolog of eukaryotic MBF1
MKQPELGTKISELRNQRGMTQKELSESCNIDIRTIQRIESGEVLPRMSTLRIVAGALSCDMEIFCEEPREYNGQVSRNVLLFLFFVGVVYGISVAILSPIIRPNSFFLGIFPVTASLYAISGVLFYYAFFMFGKHQKNLILKISSVAFMVCIPLLLISALTLNDSGLAKHIKQLIMLLLAVNDILFGIALLKVSHKLMNLYRITGMLHILIAPFILIPVSIISLISWWLIFLSIVLQLCIVYFEFRTWPLRQPAVEIV